MIQETMLRPARFFITMSGALLIAAHWISLALFAATVDFQQTAVLGSNLGVPVPIAQSDTVYSCLGDIESCERMFGVRRFSGHEIDRDASGAFDQTSWSPAFQHPAAVLDNTLGQIEQLEGGGSASLTLNEHRYQRYATLKGTAVGGGSPPTAQLQVDTLDTREDFGVAYAVHRVAGAGTQVRIARRCWVKRTAPWAMDDETIYCREGATEEFSLRIWRPEVVGWDRYFEVTTSGGTATSGVDYIPVDTFEVKMDSAWVAAYGSFTLTVHEDGEQEPYETIVQRIVDKDDPSDSSTYTFYIIDGDQPFVYFDPARTTAMECDRGLSVVMRLSEATSETVTAAFQTVAIPAHDDRGVRDLRRAEPGLDYTPVNTTITFVPGQTEVTHHIGITAESHSHIWDFEAEEFLIELSSPVNATLFPDRSNGTVVIKNELCQDTPEIVLSEARLTIPEGGSREYTVKLALKPSGPVEVNITEVNITGDNVADVTLSRTSLTFTEITWATEQIVTVHADHDVDSFDDRVKLAHRASGGGYESARKDLPVNVEDDDSAPGLVVSPSYLPVTEGTEEHFTVRLLTEPTQTVVVQITGDEGPGLTVSPRTFRYMSEDWSTPVTVTVRADQDDDSVDASKRLTLTASGGQYDGVTEAVDIDVEDDDPAVGLVVSPSYLPVTEGTEEHFTVRLLTEPTQTVVVQITGDEGPGLTVSPRTFRYMSEDWSTPVTVTVRADQDDDSMDASKRLTLTASGGQYDGVTEVVDIDVEDDDAARIVLSATEVTITEEGEESYTVHLSVEPSGTVAVEIVSDDTDVTVSDASLMFTADDWHTAQTVTVRAAQDDDTNNDEATLTHRAAGGGYDDVEEELTVMVLDDDEAGLVINPTALRLTEGAAGKIFTVRLASPPTGQMTVSVSAEPALNGKVSVSMRGLTFNTADWRTDQTVTVSALDDADSDDETGEIQLSASGGGYSGQSRAVQVDISDSDNRYRIDLVSSEVEVSEGAGFARFQVRLDREIETAISVRYNTHDETAHAGLDYERSATNTLTFEVGGGLDSWIDIPILDDRVDEDEETFRLELTDAQGAELGKTTGRATIVDNDDEPLVIMIPAVYVREGSIANVYISLSNASTKPVTVSYSTNDMTASAGDDYEAASGGSVTIEPGGMDAVVAIRTTDDAVHEGREVFVVQLDGGEQTTVTILDNDRLPQLSIGDATVSEDGEHARLAVTMDGTSAVRVGVAYATQDGTAKAGADYTRTMGTLVFALGETVRHIWVPVVRDDVVEEDEGLVVKLSAPEHAMLLDAEGDVTIKDDPIEVSIHDGTGTESSDELVMAVRLNYGSTKVVSVQFAVTGGTATSDVDYEATQGLVVFETGSTEAQVRIPLIDDDLQEGNETIEVTLSNPANAQIGQAMATGTIVDDETAPGVQVRAIAVSQSEAVFVVGLLAPVAERLTGRYRTVDGTAWAGEDYERMEGVLEFGPGETRKEVRVPLLRAQSSGEAFALMVELGDETVREEVVLGSKDTGNRARLGRSVAVHIVEAVSERMEGSLVGCMPRPFPGQRVRASHLLSGCGMQASGERISVWGRGAYSRLQSGGVSGADVVTASLGADYNAGGRWLMGMVVSRSEALEQEGTLLQVTGWYPYMRYGGMRHSVWGLAGAGQGVVAEAADTGMRMMAAGVGGTLVRRAGARLGYEADGFWLGMDGGIGVSRVRAGLEGSVTWQDILEPYVEAAVLHSGGDAERGMGMEAGGGLRVRMGMLHAEVMSRRLVLHQEDGYGEWGYAGTVRYGGMEGLGAQVRPTWGRTHVGTLWQAERPWEVYPSDRRMELEVGYGSRVHRRSVLRPHVGMGLRDRGRDYRIGAGVQGRTGLGFSVSGLAMEHMTPYRPVTYGVTASGYVRW